MFCQKWKSHYVWSCWHVGNFISVSSEHFERHCECVSDYCLIFAPHSSLLLCVNLWRKDKMTVFKHPLYSLNFPSCDFFLLPKLKMMLKWRRLNDITMIQKNLWDGPAQFQTVFYTVCLQNGMVSWLIIMEFTRRLLWREQYWFKGKYCYGNISPIWSLFGGTLYLLQETTEVTQQKKAIINFSWMWPATVLCLSPLIVALKWSFCDNSFASVLWEFSA